MSRSMSHLYDPPEELTREVRRTLPPLYIFDRRGVREVDRLAVERFGIPSIVLMENAARGACEQALDMIGDDLHGSVLIVCGSGNNGGDGYALARLLHNRHVPVRIAAIGQPRPGTDAAINREICRRMRLPEISPDRLHDPAVAAETALIVDAIFGTGLDRPVEAEAGAVINWINHSGRPVLALDLPSGLDCDTGNILGTAVRAQCTVTFVGWKVGFTSLDAQKLLGEVVVADIGAPRELIEEYGWPAEPPHPQVPEHEPEHGLHSRSRREQD